MSRYLGPRLRIVRRLGYLIGLTRKKPATKLLNPDARRGIRKVIPPGQHGRSKSFKKKPYESNEYDFLIRLKLKQRIRYHYGITEKQLVNYVRQARKIKGSTGRVLLRLLEMRLDNTVFRLHMAPTIRSARQLINHGHIYVNNKKISIPSYSCKPKDIITPAPKKRSIQLLNNYLTELDQEKSRFKNLLKIFKFGKKGLLNNTKTLQNTEEKNNQRHCKPNTIISLRIQRAGTLEGQGIGFLGKNLVIVQPLFGNIKNYLGKSINICIYLKRDNIFYGYPTKPFNIKMRYSKLINSIDAIQYFGRKKMLQNFQNRDSVKSNDIKPIKTLNKSSSAIILLGGANIFRNKLSKKNQNYRQNSPDNILVRIEAASCGKNPKYILNRKRQLSPFLLNKTRDTNPILFREKYLYSRKNRRFVGINNIFYVKMMLKSVEQNIDPSNIKNFYSLYKKSEVENNNLNSINNFFKNSFFYSKLNKINPNNLKLKESIINNDNQTASGLLFKNHSNSLLFNNIVSDNSIKLRKYYLAKLKKQNKFNEQKLSLIYWCVRKEKFAELSNLIKSKLQKAQSPFNLNTNVLYIKQIILKSLLSQITIQKNFNINYFWKAVYIFSKIDLRHSNSDKTNHFFNNSLKDNFLQTFCNMLLDRQIYFPNKNKNFSIKGFLFFSNIFYLILDYKKKTLINNSIFQKFVKHIKESLSLIILLHKSLLSLLKKQKQHSGLNIQSNLILEYYRHQEYQILKYFQTKIQSEITLHQFEKLSNSVSLNSFTNKNQFRKVLKLNSIKQEFNFYLSILWNKKIFHSNMSYDIDIFNYCKDFLNNQPFINTFFIYQNYVKNKKNLMNKQLFKYKFELQIFINLFKKTTLFTNYNIDKSFNLLQETGKKLNSSFLRKQIVQKFNLIKIRVNFKKFLLNNFVNKWNKSGFISYDQNQHFLHKITYYLSQDKYQRCVNLVSNIIEKNDGTKWNNKNLLNKLKNLVFTEKKVQKLFSDKLKYLRQLQEIENLGLIFNLNKNQHINFLTNKINFILKLIHFERNYLINKTISNNLKKKITNEHFVKMNQNIYITKINYFFTSQAESISHSKSINNKKTIEKIQQQRIQQKIKQKIDFFSISTKHENIFIKNITIFNMDKNGRYLTNFISELLYLKEKKFFLRLDKTNTIFYPIELNRKIFKQKITQMSTSWFNYILIFNKIYKIYKKNDITKNEYSILIHQAKQFIIKQLILNKNKFLIGYNNYLKLGQNNINYFINRIKNYSNIFNIDNEFEYFQYNFIQINEKYYQFINCLKNKAKLFINQSINNTLYLNKLRKLNLFNNLDFPLNNSLKEFSKEVSEEPLQLILNINNEKNNFEQVYNSILKDSKFKYKNFSQEISSNIIVKLSINIAKWVDNISTKKLQKGLNILRKQKLITKPNFKLLIYLLLKLKQYSKKLTNNVLIFDSVLLLKNNKMYQQKRIKSLINLLLNFNLSINYIKLNSDLNYPINRNVQNELNKKLFYQYYNHTIWNQRINKIIKKFVFQFKNKLQLLQYFKIFDSSKKREFDKMIKKMTNEIIQLNHLNTSMDKTSYKTTKFITQTIKFCNMFIYYHLKSSRKRNKNFILNNQTLKDCNEKNYLRDDLLTKLYSKFSILKQQNLLILSKYDVFLNKLKEQQLTKHFILNLMNEVTLLKLEQLIEFKYIHSDFIFYSKVLFFKLLTSFNLLKKRYEIKQNETNKFINKIKIQLNLHFQNQFQYILYLSKYQSFRHNDILTNQQKNQIEKQLNIIINNIKNYSKRSIKLQERLKYGFINYRKYETITQNLIKNLQFKIQKIINNSQNQQITNESILVEDIDSLMKLTTPSLAEKNQPVYFSIFNFNNFKNIKFNYPIKKVLTLQEIGTENLQKLMHFALNNYKSVLLDQQNFEWDFVVLNYLKKEFQFIQILKICQQIEINYNYLKELKNQTKTKIISQTHKIYENMTQNQTKTKIAPNPLGRSEAFSLLKNKIHSVSLIQNRKTKIQINLLQTLKISLLKNFLLKMKNIISHYFTKNCSIKISKQRLILVANIFNDVQNFKQTRILHSVRLTTTKIDNYTKKLQFNLHFSPFNHFYSKKYVFKICLNNMSQNYNYDKNLSNSKMLSIYPEFILVNLKMYYISKLLQKSYKSKILLDIQNNNNKLLNISRVQKLKLYGLCSLKNKNPQKNQQIQEMYNKLENILINSNYSNQSLILKYLQFEINTLKKSQFSQQFNNYITNCINLLSNRLNTFKNKSIISYKNSYKQIKNYILKTLLLHILISPNLDNFKSLIQNDLISNKLYNKIKKIFYRKKFIAKLQNILSKLKQNSFNDIYRLKEFFPKIILIIEKFNDLKSFNLLSKNQYNFLKTQMQQILKYEQFISRLNLIKKQGILTNIQYNQILLKIQQKIVQKVREQKIVQKFKQYIQYVDQTKNKDQLTKKQNNKLKALNSQYKKIISLNQGKWAIVAIKEFYEQNLITTLQYNEIIQKIEKNIRKKIQIAKLFSTNRNFSQLKFSSKFKLGLTKKQDKKNSKLLRSLPNIWTKNILKELRKQSIISNQIYVEIEKQVFDNYYSKTKRKKINHFVNDSSKKQLIKKITINSSQTSIKKNTNLLKKAIKSLLDYKKHIIHLLSIIETTPLQSSSDYLFNLSYLTALKSNENINQKEYNKLKMYQKLGNTRLVRLKKLQKAGSLNNMQYEKIYQKIIKSYLLIQYQYIQRLLRNKQTILQEVYYVNKKSNDKKIIKNLNKIKISSKLIKTSNTLFSLIQEVLAQLPNSTTNKNQSTYRQRIIYNRLYSKLRSDDILTTKWKQILTQILKKKLTPPLDIPPHLEFRRIQITILSTDVTKKSNKNLVIPVGTVMSLPSRKTVGVSVLERLIVEYYSRN